MAAERETNDRLIAHFLADRIGATFEGQISGVTKSGLFIKLDETGADGFVPAATIGADYYRYDDRTHSMRGERTGETYRLGDRVQVKLVEAAPVAGALRFELLSEGRFSRRTAARQRRPRSENREAEPTHDASRQEQGQAATQRLTGSKMPDLAMPLPPASAATGHEARISRPLPGLRRRPAVRPLS